MQDKLKISLPIIKTLRNYHSSWLKRDFIAGATVAAIAIPQAMAYAQLAGVQLAAGLYAALIAMLAFALFTTSRYVTVGPDAAMAALAGATVIPLAGGSIERTATLVAILSIIIGVLCLIAVTVKFSYISEFLSRPIMIGYMAGLALVIITSQIPKLFGITSPPSLTNFFGSIVYILSNLGHSSMLTVVFSSLLLLLSFSLQRKFKKLPVAIVILIGSTLVSMIFGLKGLGIAVLGDIPRGLPVPELPSIKLYDLQSLVVPAIAITLIAYANTITIGKSLLDRKNSNNIDPNQEFIGLGVANFASGIFGGIPVSGSGSRSAVNYQSRAKSQVSQIFGAIIIGISLVALTPFLSNLPVAALAVIIIVAVSNLFNYKEFKQLWIAWQSEAFLAIATILGVTLLGIIQGLLLAVFLSIMNLIRKTAFPSDAVLGVAKDGAVRDISRPPKTHTIDGLIMYRFDAPLFFGNASYFRERVMSLISASDSTVEWFLWDAETITSIDSTAAKMLVNLKKELKNKGVIFAFARMKGNVRSVISHNPELYRSLQSSPHYTSIGEGIEDFKKRYM